MRYPEGPNLIFKGQLLKDDIPLESYGPLGGPVAVRRYGLPNAHSARVPADVHPRHPVPVWRTGWPSDQRWAVDLFVPFLKRTRVSG